MKGLKKVLLLRIVDSGPGSLGEDVISCVPIGTLLPSVHLRVLAKGDRESRYPSGRHR